MLELRVNDITSQERQSRIRGSRYNEFYKDIMPEGRGAKFLRDQTIGGADEKLLIRLRTGNDCRSSAFWKPEKDRQCLKCKRELEDICHKLVKCEKLEERGIRREGGSSEEQLYSLLREDGKNVKKVRDICNSGQDEDTNIVSQVQC